MMDEDDSGVPAAETKESSDSPSAPQQASTEFGTEDVPNMALTCWKEVGNGLDKSQTGEF